MSSGKDLKVLFSKWYDLNNQVGGAFQGFDFAEVKQVRKEQAKIEDEIYEILKMQAPPDIKAILPESCGEMEMGLEETKQKFYFLMEDPEYKDEKEIHVLAITIDTDKKVDKIKDFNKEEY